MRTITIFSTRGNSRNSITTNVSTWGQLQDELYQNDIDFDGLKAIVATTQNTLESSEALLPAEAFTLMLIPSKVKSGSSYTDQPYNVLRRDATNRGITGLNVPPTKPELIAALEQHDRSNTSSNTATVSFEPASPIVERDVQSPTNYVLSKLYDLQSNVSEIISLLESNNNIPVELDAETELLRQQATDIMANLN